MVGGFVIALDMKKDILNKETLSVYNFFRIFVK
jgi:hypothetical protein